MANTSQVYLYGILSYFGHPITNATAEGNNSRIETPWKEACGYRNERRFRTAILFHLAGLHLAPCTHLGLIRK